MDDPYRWIYEFYWQATVEDCADKLNLCSLFGQAQNLGVEDSDAKIALYGQGHALAVALNEPWWSVLFEYWKGETILYYKRDPQAALHIAARLVVETRKPVFSDFPQRASVNLLFIAAYSEIDPIGYAPQIRAALADEDAAGDRYDWDSAGVHWQLRTRFLTALRDPEALGVAWQHFDFSCEYHAKKDSESSHYIIYALVDLLRALHVFDPSAARAETAELAALGEDLSRHDKNQRLNAVFTMWRAVGERIGGNQKPAQRSYRLALGKQSALSAPRNAVLEAALVFHQVGGDLEAAVKICDQALEIALFHAHHFDAASYLHKKCRLLREMNRSYGKEAAQLREIAAQLPSQTHWENQIRELEQNG